VEQQTKVHVELREFLSSTSLFGNTFMLISQCQYISQNINF